MHVVWPGCVRQHDGTDDVQLQRSVCRGLVRQCTGNVGVDVQWTVSRGVLLSGRHGVADVEHMCGRPVQHVGMERVRQLQCGAVWYWRLDDIVVHGDVSRWTLLSRGRWHTCTLSTRSLWQ